MLLLLALALQSGLLVPELPIGLPDPDAFVIVGGEIEGPFISREDSGQTTRVILKNGLTVIARENAAVPLTSVTAHVKVGYFDEPDHLAGISHVVEHMLFNGTAVRPAGQIAKETRALGGTPDTYTDFDRTVFHVVVPAENAVAAIEIQADGLWNPVFAEEDLAREIEIVLQERDHTLDSPAALVEERLFRTAFARHPIRRGRTAISDSLRALTRDEAAGFHARYYRPSNTILVVVGQIDRETMLNEIVRIHGGVTESPFESEPLFPEPPQAGLRYDWERGPIEDPQTAIGYHVPGADSEGTDAYTLEVLSSLLTSGRASRMNWFLRDEQGLISHAESSYLGLPGLGYFMLRLEAPDPGPAQVAAFGELDRLRRFGVVEEDLARAKVLTAEKHYHRLETLGGIAHELALQEARGDWKRTSFFLDGIQAVTGDDIQRVVNRYFVRENLAVFEYLPPSSSRALSDAEFEAAVLNLVPVNIVQRSIDELDVEATIQLPNDRLAIEVIPPFRRFSILRGPDVYLAEDRRLPLVSFGIFYPGGRLYEMAENAGITELMLRSALRGTRRYNFADISRRIGNAGVRIEVVNEPDFHGYLLNGLSDAFPDALEVLMEVLREPSFAEEEVERQKVLQAAAIRRSRQDNVRYPVQLFMSTLFDDHPYARTATGSEASLESLTAEALGVWHDQYQRSAMPLIVISGDTQGTSLISSISGPLTNEDLDSRNIMTLPLPGASLNEEEVAFATRRQQSALVYGTMVAPYAHADRWPLDLVQRVLAGRGGRLFSSIRDNHAFVHPVRSEDDFLARAGVLFNYFAFAPGNEDAVRESVTTAIQGLIDNGIAEDEMAQAVNSSIGAYEAALQTRRARVMEIAGVAIKGGEVSLIETYADYIRRIDRNAVRFAAERYLSPSQAKTVLLRADP